MKITPLEIRQKTFEKNFRGYEKDEVNAFLMTLSQEWERIVDENKELKFKYESTEREIQKLREVESSLYKTLKTAEDTGASVIEQARKASELHLRESQLTADQLVNEAKTRAKDTIEESEMRARQIIADMEDRVKGLIEQYKKLESTRDDMLSELKRLASDVMDKVERSRAAGQAFDPDKHLSTVRREAKKIAFPNLDYERPVAKEERREEKQETHEEELQQHDVPLEPTRKTQKSFFDEIG
ncbi:MAG: DivIVA domain-containing protein [Bacteroidota bacterium]|nr:DivIVA domain-containing protein [Bacteroidota bacterium]